MLLTLALLASLALPDCQPTENSTGMPGRLDLAGPELVRATQLPANTFTILTGGPVSWAVPFGDGVSCVNPAVGFFRTAPRPTGAESLVEWNVGAMQEWTSGGKLYFQAWYRDPGFGSFGYNLTGRVAWTPTP